MDELLANAEEHPGLDVKDLRRQMALTTYVIVSLFAVAVGIDFIGNGLPGFGNFAVTLGLAALTYLAGEHAVRQYRAIAQPLSSTGLTTRERVTFGVALLLVVATTLL